MSASDATISSYAALFLHSAGKDVSAENIASLVDASGRNMKEFEAYWPALMAKLLDGKDVAEILMKPGGPATAGGVAAAGGAAAAGGEAAAEEKPVEEEEEEDMEFDLF